MEAHAVASAPTALSHLEGPDADPFDVAHLVQNCDLVELVAVAKAHEGAREPSHELRAGGDDLLVADGVPSAAPHEPLDAVLTHGRQDVAGGVGAQVFGGVTVDADGEERIGNPSGSLCPRIPDCDNSTEDFRP